MKALVIYTSQTGFTGKYAHWLAEKVQGEALELAEAKKKPDEFFNGYDAIVYGGWAMAGTIVKVKWFLGKAAQWQGKKLALFSVGANPQGSPDAEKLLKDALNDEQRKSIRAFYFPGGLNYDAMNLPSRLVMKALSSALKKKKDATPEEKEKGEYISHSFDDTDVKYIEPLAEYILGA